MNPYIPKPHHLIFISAPLFGIGIYSIAHNLDPFDAFGWVMIALGFITAFIIAWALIWDVLIRKMDALRYLFDSARYLDRDRTSDLLIAMGLKPLPPIQKMTTVIVNKQEKGVTTQQTTYHDIPASPAQLQELAVGLLLEEAPFSRREWTGELEREKVFTQTEFNSLADYCERKKLRVKSETSNGFDPSEDFKDFLQGYLPSPTPEMETT